MRTLETLCECKTAGLMIQVPPEEEGGTEGISERAVSP